MCFNHESTQFINAVGDTVIVKAEGGGTDFVSLSILFLYLFAAHQQRRCVYYYVLFIYPFIFADSGNSRYQRKSW